MADPTGGRPVPHDPDIAGLRIGGAFQVTDVDTFVAALRPFGVHALLHRINPDDPASEVIGLVGQCEMGREAQ